MFVYIGPGGRSAVPAGRELLEAVGGVVEEQDGEAAGPHPRPARQGHEDRVFVVLEADDQPQVDPLAPHDLRQDVVQPPGVYLVVDLGLAALGEDVVDVPPVGHGPVDLCPGGSGRAQQERRDNEDAGTFHGRPPWNRMLPGWIRSVRADGHNRPRAALIRMRPSPSGILSLISKAVSFGHDQPAVLGDGEGQAGLLFAQSSGAMAASVFDEQGSW